MFGDYYTNNLLSASPRTSMIGNLIDNTISSPLVGQAASMVVVLMLLLLLPMLYYLYATNRATRTGTA
jgi:ABC-type spermidine/putrescine transport system permease subunit I